MKRKILKVVGLFFAGLLLLILALWVYLLMVARVQPPATPPDTIGERTEIGKNYYTLRNNRFRKSESGLYELYVEGTPYERGLANGRLTQELVQYQETVFNAQIHRLVPSGIYLGLLRYFVGWFNRDLDKSIPEEYKLEIAGVSEAASPQFNDIAQPYQRILNYHAAHDIGHALQNMSLVGCTSFATWGTLSQDSSLIIGRNFDFYVGDEFARDKIVAFYRPEKGHPFMMVTWGGMTGVLSGMNLEGLTVTINAAKSDIPSGSATPVSLVAREILQYASTIDEAFQIANRRKMFVSESFLIGSARDHKAAIIEKSPEKTVLYDPGNEWIISTNHFQSKELGETPLNLEHLRTSASPYRMQRVEELLKHQGKNTVTGTASILRNQLGLKDRNIGLGNEKSVNQLIAHHSIIFQPEQHRVWVSTAPWQLGKYVCYDLEKIFQDRLSQDREVYEANLTIPADSFLLDKRFPGFVRFSGYRYPFQSRDSMQADSLIQWNPDGYLAYLLAGDQASQLHDYAKASAYYQTALKKEIATEQEKEHIVKNLARSNEKMK